MPNLFSTLGRAALVAIGLTVAASASAQTNYSFQCPAGYTSSVSGAGTSNVSVSCTPDAGGGDVAPGGCQLGRSPSSGGPGATDVTLTLSCASGTLPINVAWEGGSAPGNCPPSMDALSKTCVVPGVAANTIWKVLQFSNSVGNGTNNANKTASFTYNAGGGGGGGFAGCPSNATTNEAGSWSGEQTLWNGVHSYKLAPGTGASGATYGPVGAQYYNAGEWEWNISTVACDFSGATDVWAVSSAGKIRAYKAHGLTVNSNLANAYYDADVNVPRGGTYYFNIRSISCLSGQCGMKIVGLEGY